MSERFTPVSCEAKALVGRDCRLAVHDLYERGHECGWGEFTMTERQMADDWHIGKDRVWTVLETLQRAGKLVFERGDRRTRRPTRIRVLAPTREADPTSKGSSAGSTGGQYGNGATPNRIERPPVPGPADPAPRVEETRAPLEIRDETKSQPVAAVRAREPAAALPVGGHIPAFMSHADVVNACSDLAATVGRSLGPDDQAEIRQAAAEGWLTADNAPMLWRWAHDSPDREAELAREGDDPWAHLWRALVKSSQGKGRRRMQKAEAWHAAGRPDRATGPPARAAPATRRSAAADHLDDLLTLANER